MHLGPPIRIDATKILSRRELAAVLDDLHRKAPRSANTWLNLILVRLSCCCGLRVSEIAGLRISDIWSFWDNGRVRRCLRCWSMPTVSAFLCDLLRLCVVPARPNWPQSPKSR